jgi:hypothetical protein
MQSSRSEIFQRNILLPSAGLNSKPKKKPLDSRCVLPSLSNPDDGYNMVLSNIGLK